MGVSASTERGDDSMLDRSKTKRETNGTPLANASVTEDESSATGPDTTEYSARVKHNRKTSVAKTPIRRNTAKNNIGITVCSSGDATKSVTSSHITDDQVHVNLAMADLMAYLQVVATNSQNLPMTRRDDPELGKTVSLLSTEEYARKSAAFIPADIRVIAGSFTKYGRVWDLPTSEEYSANDGAQEPGRSHGGACCNSMLKVLYDAANEAADEAHEASASDGIFDEDDDESMMTTLEMGRARTFESLVLGTVPTTITWANLLRKMKSEIHEIEYAQTPVVTSSRKIDLNKPFSLVPEGFDPKKNAMRSLLIGCNYTGIAGAELKASHDDVRSVKDYIVNVHGFPEIKGLMTVLMDDKTHKPPTHLNIVESLKALAEQSQPGDVIFIQMTGHGGRVLDSVVDAEAESYDEAFAPSDYQVSGLIRDILLYKILLAPMRYGVTVTMVIDTCDTGMIVDLPYVWSTKHDRRETNVKLSTNDNFSFIRFLKVVKTLYESSTFTQLGKTVGTALRKPSDFIEEHTIVEESGDEVGSLTTMDKADETISGQSAQQGILRALAACTSPQNMPECAMEENSGEKKEESKARKGQVQKAPSSANASLLEQVMSCTLGHTGGDYFSDDDDTLGTDTLGETTTYDSLTDDGYESNRGRRNRGRRR